jgi:hypothetical protein
VLARPVHRAEDCTGTNRGGCNGRELHPRTRGRWGHLRLLDDAITALSSALSNFQADSAGSIPVTSKQKAQVRVQLCKRALGPT